MPAIGGDDEAPLLSLILIAYRQADTVAEALQGALAQTYSPLEIIASDDCSPDATFDALQAAAAGYAGPHRLVLNRNARNLGIGAHISHLVSMSRGELIVVAAGDDVSLPQRCARVAAAWLASGKRLDLIASALEDMDADGSLHAPIVPSDLASYRDAADWIARPPFVVGAAQAWTRRLFDRFGPLPEGVVAEDLVMVFRAIVSGGAATLAEPLVRYRRGGLSRKRSALSAQQVVDRWLANSRHSLVELPLLLADASRAGQLPAVDARLRAQLARETFIRDLFAAHGAAARLRVVASAHAVPWSQRARCALYALCPALLAPLFFAKRIASAVRAGSR